MQLLLIFLFILFFFDLAFTWKAERHPVKQVFITSSFGETKSEVFAVTSEYASKQRVRAISDGEVIYQENHENIPIRPYFGKGDNVIIEHTKGIRSYYLGLKKNSIPKKLNKISGDVEIGETSFQSDIGRFTMRLMLEDSLQKKIINPLSVLPSIDDKRSPKAQSVFVLINENVYSFKNSNPSFRYRGEMKLYGIAKDHIALREKQGLTLWPKGVKKVSFYIDGEIWREYNFDHLLIKDDNLVLPPNYSHEEIYGVPFNFKFGKFVPTKRTHVFELTCEDWVGNRDSKKYKINFR